MNVRMKELADKMSSQYAGWELDEFMEHMVENMEARGMPVSFPARCGYIEISNCALDDIINVYRKENDLDVCDVENEVRLCLRNINKQRTSI